MMEEENGWKKRKRDGDSGWRREKPWCGCVDSKLFVFGFGEKGKGRV